MTPKTTTTPDSGSDSASELAFLTRALKAPTLREAVPRLAERARAESWTHEEFLAACLQREVTARESHGGEGRVRAARFPARKSLEEFDFDHARGLRRDVIAHLGTLDFVAAKDNVVFLGPPGTGKTHLATGIAIRACHGGHRVLFATASQWVDRLATAHHHGTLQDELRRLGRYPLIVIDEVGYIPFEPEAANLFLPARVLPLRTSLPDRHLQQALRPLGRSVRRRRRGRRNDRQTGPPRRSHRPQRRLLPATQPRPRTRPRHTRRPGLTMTKPKRGVHFHPSPGVHFQPTLTLLNSFRDQSTWLSWNRKKVEERAANLAPDDAWA
jgi:DNA replication protein DnaC